MIRPYSHDRITRSPLVLMPRRSLRPKSTSSSREQPVLRRRAKQSRSTRSNPAPSLPVEFIDASLEFRDVTVTIATPSESDDELNALRGFKYNRPLEGDEDAVCWVAVPPSRRFCIHVAYNGVSPPAPNAGLSCRVQIDGTGVVCSAFINAESISRAVAQRINNKPVVDGQVEIVGPKSDHGDTIRPLCFFERPTTDSDGNIPPSNLNQFGTVEVLVGWSTGRPKMKGSHPGWECDLELLTNPIDEKIKDVQYRYVGGLGPAEHDPDRDAWRLYSTTPIQDYFVFHFKYRDPGW
ncbi:hypothetical protein FRC12_017725 [Ceratobasidium sp. 428]|nr:hypothetical protein FRC12_017725 [Ceratobasidium sp. 428]